MDFNCDLSHINAKILELVRSRLRTWVLASFPTIFFCEKQFGYGFGFSFGFALQVQAYAYRVFWYMSVNGRFLR